MFRGGGGARTVGVRPSVSYNPRIIGHGAHRPQGGQNTQDRGAIGRPAPFGVGGGGLRAASNPRPPWRGPLAGGPRRARLRGKPGTSFAVAPDGAFVSAPAGPPSCARASPPWSARRFFAAASCRRTATQKPGAGPGSCRGCAWCVVRTSGGRRADVVQGMNTLILPQG